MSQTQCSLVSRKTAVIATAATALVVAATVAIVRRRRNRRSLDASKAASSGGRGCGSRKNVSVRILYGSTTGTSKSWANTLKESIAKEMAPSCCKATVDVSVEDLATFPFDTLLTKPQRGPAQVVVVMLSTDTDGLPPPHCAHFSTLLDDHVHDFRVDKTALAHLHFAVAGFGSSCYEDAGHFCTAASNVDTMLRALAARRLVPLERVCDTEDPAEQMSRWSSGVIGALHMLAAGADVASVEPSLAVQPDSESESDSDDESTRDSGDAAKAGSDVEDLVDSCAGQVHLPKTQVKEMVTKKHREQLTKEGYKIIGTHSAVKLCRWTKHQLRGRGACYKHSFYGITSSQCMEATPSLACANKCTFCWRHHKNPVGTSWKWSMDAPERIVAEGLELHKKMINECRGIPGVKKERWEEAMTVKHCALSLVGEPIMYPKINELIGELHKRKISTFLVTNAQFPDAIDNLVPITQLYVSVDAATPETLKAVDRPLFTDFWERYLSSLRALRQKRQRTVYRMTLVKDHNMSNAADYANLVALGEPDLIEIKSVTFCGESKASSLSIGNVPWHEEVKNFAEAMLAEHGLADEYELACEHQHSCIVLIAHKRYKIDGKWHTWINYDRFNELVAEGKDFDAMDYIAPTPDWAMYGSSEAGFDPKETRVFHNKTKRKAKAGLLSEEQLRHYPYDPALQD